MGSSLYEYEVKGFFDPAAELDATREGYSEVITRTTPSAPV